MVAIRSEHDTQNRRIQAQKVALDGVINDLGSVNSMRKDKDAAPSDMASPMPPVPDSDGLDIALEQGVEDSVVGAEETEEVDKEDGEESSPLPVSRPLSVAAKPFVPGEFHKNDPADDIEMGEVEEEYKVKGKKKVRDEELEEGEASDSSSALSDPPDD